MSSVEHTQIVKVVNEQGLHSRPCHSIVTTALEFRSDLRIRLAEREVNGKSILELMTLGAAFGSELTLSSRGEDAEKLLAAISVLFTDRFGEG